MAIGSIMYPALISRGYSKSFALGAIASAGTPGIIIPPSIPLILYGIMTEENIAQLFVAGIGPGLLLTMLFAYTPLGQPQHCRATFSLAEVGRRSFGGMFAMPAAVHHDRRHLQRPVQPHRGGGCRWLMRADRFLRAPETNAPPVPAGAELRPAREALPATREMNFRTLIDVILETTKLLATLLPLLCIAGSLNTILDHSGVPKQMVAAHGRRHQDRWLLMMGINVLLLIVGCLMDVGSAILMLAPLLSRWRSPSASIRSTSASS